MSSFFQVPHRTGLPLMVVFYRGQVVIIWSVVHSPHSHAASQASPHLHIDALLRQTPVLRRFSRVHCLHGGSALLMPQEWASASYGPKGVVYGSVDPPCMWTPAGTPYFIQAVLSTLFLPTSFLELLQLSTQLFDLMLPSSGTC